MSRFVAAITGSINDDAVNTGNGIGVLKKLNCRCIGVVRIVVRVSCVTENA